MSEASDETEKPKAAGALCINGRPACWYSPDLFFSVPCRVIVVHRGPVETIPPFFGDKTNVSVLSQHIDWDLAETKGTGTEVIK